MPDSWDILYMFECTTSISKLFELSVTLYVTLAHLLMELSNIIGNYVALPGNFL